MKACGLLTLGMMVCLPMASARADDKKETADNAKLLVGNWEMKEGRTTYSWEFSKDGTISFQWKDKGGDDDGFNGVYTVEGDRIQYTLKSGRTKSMTIKKISEDELVVLYDATDEHKFKRVK